MANSVFGRIYGYFYLLFLFSVACKIQASTFCSFRFFWSNTGHPTLLKVFLHQTFDTPPLWTPHPILCKQLIAQHRNPIYASKRNVWITPLIFLHSIPYPVPHSHSNICAHAYFSLQTPHCAPHTPGTPIHYSTLHTPTHDLPQTPHSNPRTAKFYFSLSHSTLLHVTFYTPHLTPLIAPRSTTLTCIVYFLNIKKKIHWH